MKYGVKIGPERWREVLEATRPKYCEVWFRIDQEEQFREIFEYLQSHNIEFGLHFWAILPAGYEPNLAFEPDGIADQTQELIERSIDIAKRVGAHYVNVHSGSLRLKMLNLEERMLEIVKGEEVGKEKAWSSLLPRCRQLGSYARQQGVLFLVETLTKNDLFRWDGPRGELNFLDSKNITPDMVAELANNGIHVTNDLAHTAMSTQSENRGFLFDNLFRITKLLAPQTRIVHLNTVVPPFNGTDSHNGVLEKDFAAGAFPSREQLIELLKIFKDRDDVWLIPEPEVSDMVENYFEIEKLLSILNV